ncbi:MAG: ABC transporter substrate-binding protein [Candidatus Ornithospirochaeta sp.]|nr:ABC transporter substrate-binding protein [Candidatus Ornithospirochaeta sp.]
MKKIMMAAMALMVSAMMVFANGTSEASGDKPVKIGISKLLSHPALDSIAQGITDYLDTTGISYTVDIQNANGDISTCASIAQLFKTEGIEYPIGIATPTAQALANVFAGKTMIYSSVTDPAAAGLEGLENVCGVTDMVPVQEHLSIIERLTGAKRIGMIYTSGEANGISLMTAMKEACDAAGVELVTVSIANSSEVRVAAQSIIDRIDAMYIATDNTVVSAITAVSDVCIAKKIPLFSADTTSSFGTEVLLAGGFDYYASGVLTGKLVERIINGESPASIGKVYLDNLEIYVNLDVAGKIGVEIPQDMIDSAAFVIKDGQEIAK